MGLNVIITTIKYWLRVTLSALIRFHSIRTRIFFLFCFYHLQCIFVFDMTVEAMRLNPVSYNQNLVF